MRLLIDTNVVLDVLLKRPPFYETGARVLKLSSQDDVQEFVSASAITDIYYIAYRSLRDKNTARTLLRQLLQVISIAAVSESEISCALDFEWNDFEDSVQYSVALLGSMDGVVTRNTKDFEDSELPIWSPEELLQMVED